VLEIDRSINIGIGFEDGMELLDRNTLISRLGQSECQKDQQMETDVILSMIATMSSRISSEFPVSVVT
jgi:hypothetical protein